MEALYQQVLALERVFGTAYDEIRSVRYLLEEVRRLPHSDKQPVILTSILREYEAELRAARAVSIPLRETIHELTEYCMREHREGYMTYCVTYNDGQAGTLTDVTCGKYSDIQKLLEHEENWVNIVYDEDLIHQEPAVRFVEATRRALAEDLVKGLGIEQ